MIYQLERSFHSYVLSSFPQGFDTIILTDTQLAYDQVGYTRNEFQGREVTHLEYEAYIPLAIKTIDSILLEARSLPALSPSTSISTCCSPSHQHTSLSTGEEGAKGKIEITRMTVHHLLGPSPPLTPSLVICVASPHRREAFYVCEWLLERVKERVQVWKREFYADGAEFVGRDGEGVEAKSRREQDEKNSQWKVNFPPA